MNKLLKKILTVALAVVCALSLVACGDADNGENQKGLFCKKISGVYTIYKYVDDGETTSLDIATELAELGITDTNIKIKKQAFNGNSSLKEIIVPASVTEIDEGAFAGMKALESLSIPFVGMNANGDSSVYETAPATDKATDAKRTIAYIFGTTSYEEGISQTITYGNGSEQTINCYMPITLSKITVTGSKIPACAFNGLTQYVEITLSGNVEVIGDYAFANTTQLSKITLPATVKKIGEGAFFNATALKEINLSQLTALEEIGNNAFNGAPLTEIVTPSSLKTIGVEAFYGCKSLKKVTLNEGLKTINRYAFMDCESLETVDVTAVTTKIQTLGNYAFANCEKLGAVADVFENVGINAFKK